MLLPDGTAVVMWPSPESWHITNPRAALTALAEPGRYEPLVRRSLAAALLRRWPAAFPDLTDPRVLVERLDTPGDRTRDFADRALSTAYTDPTVAASDRSTQEEQWAGERDARAASQRTGRSRPGAVSPASRSAR